MSLQWDVVVISFARAISAVACTICVANEAAAFERIGVPWCDQLLSRYERCLRSVTYKRCEAIVKRFPQSRTYQQPGPAGAARGPHTFPTPAAACVAETKDLLGEMQANVMVLIQLTPAGSPRRSEFCNSMRSLIRKNMRGRLCSN